MRWMHPSIQRSNRRDQWRWAGAPTRAAWKFLFVTRAPAFSTATIFLFHFSPPSTAEAALGLLSAGKLLKHTVAFCNSPTALIAPAVRQWSLSPCLIICRLFNQDRERDIMFRREWNRTCTTLKMT